MSLPENRSHYLMPLVSRPVAHFPSPLPSPRGTTAQNATAYNRAEHNIFLKMQMADPLLGQASHSNVPGRLPVSQEESNERGKGIKSGETDKVGAEERETSQLSSSAYDK